MDHKEQIMLSFKTNYNINVNKLDCYKKKNERIISIYALSCIRNKPKRKRRNPAYLSIRQIGALYV